MRKILLIIIAVMLALTSCVTETDNGIVVSHIVEDYFVIENVTEVNDIEELVNDDESLETMLESEEDIISPRYGFTEEDIYLLSQLIAGDKNKIGDGEYDFTWAIQHGFEFDFIEIYKVLCVVMNRVRSKDFPSTVSEVILQRGQFAVIPRNLKTDPDPLVITEIRAWCEKYDGWWNMQIIPEDHLYFEAGPHNGNITSTTWRRKG